METARIYLEKHAAGDPLIKASPEKGLKYIVVIPSYLETRLTESLVSLFEADLPPHPVEVIIIINWPENENPENIRLSREAFISASKWAKAKSTNKLRFHTIEAGFFPVKKAGVGYARKTGMDEAVRRFIQAGQEDGIIISFDADSKCEKNYFTAIDAHFSINNQTDGCSVYFEHELAGDEFPEIVYEAITQYELHMRTYLHGVRYTGFPNAFYTVGSSMVVRASSYCRQGGMNVRKAGEDFYFLQKFFDLGRFTDLKETIVYPSPRPSLRVPFGTGKAITERIKETTSMKSYNPATYDVLRHFFSAHKELNTDRKVKLDQIISGCHPCLQEFLLKINFRKDLQEINNNSGNLENFSKRFYRYFNMFRILKFANYARTTFPDLSVAECAIGIMKRCGLNPTEKMVEKEMLLAFRKRDKND